MCLMHLFDWVFGFAAGRATAPDSGREYSRQDSALEILKRRYARGEITIDEYERVKKDLS